MPRHFMPGILKILQKGTEVGNLPTKVVPYGGLSLAPGACVAASAGGNKTATGSVTWA
jgi:hypothetical protein